MDDRSVQYLTRKLILIVLLASSCAPNLQDIRLDTTQPPNTEGYIPVSGRLIDLKTGEAVTDALIFLSGTTLSAEPDSLGYFSLGHAPPGMYVMLVDMPHCKRVKKPLNVSRMLHNMDFYIERTPLQPAQESPNRRSEVVALKRELRKKMDEMQSIRKALAELTSETWMNAEEEINLFHKIVVGQADLCKLINPEILEFETEGNKWNFKIVYHASEPLLIENRWLGYCIRLYIDEVTLRKYKKTYSLDHVCHASFTQLQPEDIHESRDWRIRRERAYDGSFKHFLHALASHRLIEEGFTLLKPPAFQKDSESQRPLLGYSKGRREWIQLTDPYRIIHMTERENVYKLSFDNVIRVMYRNDVPSEKPERLFGLKGDYQISHMFLREGPVLFNRNGQLLETKQVNMTGFWGTEQLCALLPMNYIPIEQL